MRRFLLMALVAAALLFGLAALALASESPAEKRAQAEQIVTEFWDRVWTPPVDLQAVDDLVVEDFVLTSAGSEITGREAFRAWLQTFQSKVKDARLEAVETFANASATRVTSRWRVTARNGGVLGTKPDGRPIAFTGIAIWEVRWTPDGPKLAQNWVERSAWELYRSLTAEPAD